jgi:hypothetical protein
MIRIEFAAGSVQVDAAVIGQGLGLDPALVHDRMRANEITSVCERGVDEDAGRYRLTFFHGSRRFRVIFDENGNVLRRSTINFGDRATPLRFR